MPLLNSLKQPSTESANASFVDRTLGGIVDFFASIRLTVVCLSFAMALVLIGTLAQVELGLYTAQERYFRSFFVFWGPAGASWKLPVLPGGYLVGGVLLLNLLASFFNRVVAGKRGIGIWLIHVGLILLLVGQLLTDMLSVESAMQLTEGETKNFSEDFRAIELAVVDGSDASSDLVYSIPLHRLSGQNGVTQEGLPFRIELKKYWPNAGLIEPSRRADNPGAIASGATQGSLKDILVVPQEITKNMDQRNTPAAVLEFFEGTKSAGTFLVSPLALNPQEVTVAGKPFQVSMRFTRYYYPFSITLLKATHEKYKGTEIPKNFASRIRLDNQVTSETRETVIKMNDPLRYGGQTFYQYQMSAGELAQRQGMAPSSTFQVVRNPSWLTPYISTIIVSAGLLAQFGIHLVRFVRRKRV